MKKAGLIVIIILLTGIIAFYLLWSKPSNNVQLVKIKGIESIANISKGYFDWMSSTRYSAEKLNAIPAQENDLIYFLSDIDDEKALIMPNVKPTNKVITISFDSVGAYLDDRLVNIRIGGKNGAVEQWLSQSTKDDLRHLQTVWITDSITDNNLQQLKKIGASNSNIGLIMDTDNSFLAQAEVLLKPTWLWMTDGKITAEMVSNWNKLNHLESLILIDANVDQARWDEMKKLKRLHLLDPDSLSDAQLSQLPKGLLSLQISNANLKNLNFLNGYTQLKEVSFNYCNELNDISALARLSRLTSLSLTHCDSIPGLKALYGLKELKWFAPPKNISEQELASIVSNNPDLESLVLVDCSHIKSLHMLKDMDKLSYLSLTLTPLHSDSLLFFKDLKYLSYGGEDSTDSLSIGKLQKQLPNTLVTTAEPFCMGSGWLIVYFGLIILLTLVILRVKSNISL